MTQKQLRENTRHARLREQWKRFLHADKMKCCTCGYHRCFAALQYHHTRPGEKDFAISSFLQRAFNQKNQAILLKELGKCLCLCANCHAELHENIKTIKEKGETQ